MMKSWKFNFQFSTQYCNTKAPSVIFIWETLLYIYFFFYNTKSLTSRCTFHIPFQSIWLPFFKALLNFQNIGLSQNLQPATIPSNIILEITTHALVEFPSIWLLIPSIHWYKIFMGFNPSRLSHRAFIRPNTLTLSGDVSLPTKVGVNNFTARAPTLCVTFLWLL